MENQDEDVTIACTLTDEEFRARRTLARQTILPTITKYERIRNGLSLSFSNSPETCSAVEEFILLEKGCCGFLTFDLAPEPISLKEPIMLSITGPSDAGQFIDIFVELIRDEEAGPDAQDAA